MIILISFHISIFKSNIFVLYNNDRWDDGVHDWILSSVYLHVQTAHGSLPNFAQNMLIVF